MCKEKTLRSAVVRRVAVASSRSRYCRLEHDMRGMRTQASASRERLASNILLTTYTYYIGQRFIRCARYGSAYYSVCFPFSHESYANNCEQRLVICGENHLKENSLSLCNLLNITITTYISYTYVYIQSEYEIIRERMTITRFSIIRASSMI